MTPFKQSTNQSNARIIHVYIGLYYTVIVIHANLHPTDKTIAVGVESGLNNNALIYYSTPR